MWRQRRNDSSIPAAHGGRATGTLWPRNRHVCVATHLGAHTQACTQVSACKRTESDSGWWATSVSTARLLMVHSRYVRCGHGATREGITIKRGATAISKLKFH